MIFLRMNFFMYQFVRTNEEAETFGCASKQHRGSNGTQNSTNVFWNCFVDVPRISLMILHQDENIVNSDSQH